MPTKFWKEYDEADILQREEKLKLIVDRIDELFDLKDEKLRKHTLLRTLMGYFDDLIEYSYVKK